MAEIIVGFVIYGIVSGIMIGIGVSQMKSKNPVSMNTGEKPPRKDELTDVGEYNKKHGLMWILYGSSIICSYLIAGLLSNVFNACMITTIIVVGGIFIMMWYHKQLMRRYMK